MNLARQTTYFLEEERQLLRTLLYFDIFDYPLTLEETVRYSPGTSGFSSHQSLENLVSQKIIFRLQNFYSIKNDPELIVRRLKGNALAERKMKTAKRFSFFISFFPFVRAVMLSGSISKGYMDEKSDIDYFIITDANRLWIVRASLALFRRVFLFNSGRNLCTNYFIDTKNLEIGEKNIFTAIELGTLKPMFGTTTIRVFQLANQWALSFLPNLKTLDGTALDKNLFLKNWLEKLFSTIGADDLNRWLMNRTIAYWKRRYANELEACDFEIAFRSTSGISKSHPQFFQKRVLNRYHQKIQEFEIQQGIDLAL